MEPRIIISACWFILAIVFIKFIGLDELSRKRKIEAWPLVEASIVESKLTEILHSEKVFLDLEIEANIEGKTHHWSRTFAKGKREDMEPKLSSQLAAGNSLQIHVNPEDPTEISFPALAFGRWLLGFVIGCIFMLLSIATFLKKEVQQDEAENSQET